MVVSGCKSPKDLANTLASLYEQRMESKEAKVAKLPNQDVNRMVGDAEVRLLKFLVKELKGMTFQA